jgi:hypothetical protein
MTIFMLDVPVKNRYYQSVFVVRQQKISTTVSDAPRNRPTN